MAGRRDGAGPEAPEEALAFETMLERLEAVVERLEGGELPLEEALRAFEEGVGLSRRCAEQLADAERRIEELVRRGGGFVARPFEPADEDDEDVEIEDED